jgi:hypothetical protein
LGSKTYISSFSEWFVPLKTIQKTNLKKGQYIIIIITHIWGQYN